MYALLFLLAACGGDDLVDYAITGTVVDHDTEAPIAGISVVFHNETTTSAADGTFAFSLTAVSSCGDACQVIASDTDGADNGTYEDAVLPIFPEEDDAGVLVANTTVPMTPTAEGDTAEE